MRTRLPRLSKPAAWLALAAGVVSLSAAAVAYAGPSSEQPAPTPVARGVALDPMNRPDVYQSLSPQHRQALDRENASRNRALTPGPGLQPGSDIARGNPAATRIALPNHPLGAGLLVEDSCMGLYPSADYSGGAKWLVPFEGHEVAICPGAVKSNPSQGVVRISHWSDGGRMISIRDQQVFSDEGTGRLRIVDATGTVATLQAENGSLIYFDAATLSFVAGPTTAAPPTPG